jgi:hypothetical protein
MIRTQIQLSADQHRRLKRWAVRLGISLSEAIRRCVSDRLAEEEEAPSREELVAAALSVCGKYEDPGGASRVGHEHDRYLAEAYAR